MPHDMATTVEDLVESFELMDDWAERYQLLMEIGGELEPLDDADRVETHKVKGCLSQVWLVEAADSSPEKMHFVGDSDAHIVKGIVRLLLLLVNGKPATEVAAFDPAPTLAELGLDKHLSPGRTNGLHSMVGVMKKIATRHV